MSVYLDCQKQLTHYYQYFRVNSHNKFAALGAELNQRIQQARSQLGQLFAMTPTEISFQPNITYAKLIALQIIGLQKRGTIYYYNENPEFFTHNILRDQMTQIRFQKLTTEELISAKINTLNHDDQNILLWISEINQVAVTQFINFLNTIKKEHPKLFVFVDLSYLLYADFMSLMPLIDAFVFNPFIVFQILGTVVLGIKSQLHSGLVPIIFGGGMNRLVNNQFVPLPFPTGFEGGTQNDLKNLLVTDLLCLYAKNQRLIFAQLQFYATQMNHKDLLLSAQPFVFYDQATAKYQIIDFNNPDLRN